MPRVIMLVDLDYFYAQCEEKRNTTIKDKPIVVCVYSGRTEESGAVSTANYIARRYGVKSGIPIYQAKRKLKGVDAVFLPMDRKFYEEVSGHIMDILESFANSFEQVGIDEAFLDVTQKVQEDFEEAIKLARKIKEEVKAREGLTCSIGVGPNKLISKIAADYQKPDGLTIVGPEQVQGFLAPLPITSLIGVGVKTNKIMESLEVNTIGDLAKYDAQRLIEVFGKNLGAYFHQASLGIDETPVKARGEAESISRIATLKQNTRNLGSIIETAFRLCDDVHAKLIEKSFNYRYVGIVAILTNLSVHSRSKTFETPTNDPGVLKTTVKELINRFLDEPGLDVRRIGVKVSGFTKEQKKQKHLTDFVLPVM